MIESLLMIGGAVFTGHDIYEIYRTCQSILCGKGPVQRQIEKSVQEQVQLQIQKLSSQLYYGANLDGVYWQKPPPNLSEVAPTAADLLKLATPVQKLTTAFNQGQSQTLLGSSLIHLPFGFNVNKVIDPCFIDYFIRDGHWPPAAPGQIWVVYPIYDNAGNANYHVGRLPLQSLASQGLGLHQNWQPNRIILPPELRCPEDTIRTLAGLKPLPKSVPKPINKIKPPDVSFPATDTEINRAASKPNRFKLAAMLVSLVAFIGLGFIYFLYLPKKEVVVPASVNNEPAVKTDILEPEMVSIPAGCFMMGSPASEKGRYSNEKRHRVCVKAFQMGKYEVTVAEYAAFLNAQRPNTNERKKWVETKAEDSTSNHLIERNGRFQAESGYERYPVNNVSWYGAAAYAKWLAQQTGKNYRLPTEAEWEYAARGGTQTRYWWGDQDPVCRKGARNGAKFDDNAQCDDTGTEPVGSYQANQYGLYDVVGNLWEWTCSKYTSSYDGSEMKCLLSSGAARVFRGGSWLYYADDVRAASRDGHEPGSQDNDVGFRACEVQVK